MSFARLSLLPLLLALPAPALALTPDEIETAAYDGGDLPDGQSALTVKIQVLLDRAAISPGVIDGYKGGMSESAIRAFENREGLPEDGILDEEVWAALGGDAAEPVLQAHIITADDLAEVTGELPEDYAELAELDLLGYATAAEALAERFHMDRDFLEALNPDAAFAEGETITVAAPGDPIEGEIVRIEVRKGPGRLAGFDEADRMILNYPVTVGSDATPTPSGTFEVVAVAIDPTYHYNPDENFQQGDNAEPLELPPGPNGPVGSIWIDLSEPTYGLHGTPNPAQLFESQSHGCVRMTNWDAEELANLVSQGTVVEFVEG